MAANDAAQRSGLMRWPFPPRFSLFLGAAPVATAALNLGGLRWGQAVLAGFDLAALMFIISLGSLRRDATADQMRRIARHNDTSRLGILLITALMVGVVITAVTIDLPIARKATGIAHQWALGLVLVSLVITWLFANAVMALHYAHLYYREDANGEGGLNFPDPCEKSADAPPTPVLFDDFAYFSLTIGMAFATSDVEIATKEFRWVVTLHSAAAFFYNLIVLAFTVNVTASG